MQIFGAVRPSMKAGIAPFRSPKFIYVTVALFVTLVALSSANTADNTEVKLFSTKAGVGTAACSSILMAPIFPNGTENLAYGIGLRTVALVELPRNNAGLCQGDPGQAKLEEPSQRRRIIWFDDDLICNQTSGTRILDLNGNHMNYTYAKFTSATYTNLSVTVETAFVQSAHSERIGQSPLFANYSPSGLKISFGIENWPWVRNDSSLALYMTLFFRVPEFGSLNVTSRPGGRKVTNIIGDAMLELDMDINFVTDDLKVFTSWSDNDYSGAYDPTALAVPFALGFCNNRSLPGQYQKLSYDPTLTALFGSPVSPDVPQTPEQAGKNKKSNSWVIPVSIVVVLVALAAVGIIAFLWVKHRKELEKRDTARIGSYGEGKKTTSKVTTVEPTSERTATVPATEGQASKSEQSRWSTAAKPPRESAM